MEVTVSGRHIDVTAPIRAYAVKRLGKLSRYYDRVMAAEVVIDKADPHRFDVEVRIKAELGDPFVVRVVGEDVYAALDDAEKKLERKLTAFKEKRRNRKHLPSSRAPQV